MIRLGYPTQNLTIPATANRTLRLANLPNAGRVRDLVRTNIADLEKILPWNAEHDIRLFRMGQSLIPFASHPTFPYDWAAEHDEELRDAGELARSLGIRPSMHPGQFIQPGSLRPEVVERSLMELRYVARVFDSLGAPEAVLVLHMGGAYEDRPATAARFVEVLRRETEVLRYPALENDERVWSVAEIAPTATDLGVPAIVDVFHHGINPGGSTLRRALDLALPTWKSARPKLHLSSQDPSKRPSAHAYTVEDAAWRALLLEVLDGRERRTSWSRRGARSWLSRRSESTSGNIHSLCEETRRIPRSKPCWRAPTR